jgi:hypothetical protein
MRLHRRANLLDTRLVDAVLRIRLASHALAEEQLDVDGGAGSVASPGRRSR